MQDLRRCPPEPLHTDRQPSIAGIADEVHELVPLLAERGIQLSREQVFRLVTQPPQRLSMDTLAALCDILDCTPNDLIEVEAVNAKIRKTAGESSSPAPAVRRTSIRRPEGL
ncbi:helix-turn-helix domain-containing protein [Nonomuraea sp. ZG12]|uniref:helix-turn-helix domain-containing protein n=1 Tax=Nonomuraea sp. ZG12 TaxID=3452207 RepID=UPI003F8B65CA